MLKLHLKTFFLLFRDQKTIRKRDKKQKKSTLIWFFCILNLSFFDQKLNIHKKDLKFIHK
ncbi:hypothetical protein DOS84_07515 [Flavobacterium aquariorum]|uniref:Uncharacterized protein n=1 Tax=Flavobacterium aquariorum TaxID=2217670 RepID=A0A2W7UF63_9FLAO|nr:hypothetical protein DOS84_07515 [Flavobacterium aquariorum]